MVKCSGNINLNEMDTQPSTEKMTITVGIFKEYIKQNIIMAVLRKANAHSVVIC